MKNEKPLAVRFAKGLLLFKILFIILIIITFLFVRNLQGDSALVGVKDAIMDNLNLISNDPDYALGKLVGKSIVHIVIAVITIVLLHNRQLMATIIALLLSILIFISQGIPFIEIAVLILLLTKQARNYLKKTAN